MDNVIKVGLYVKGNIETDKGFGGRIYARVLPDMPRFDLSEAAVVHGDMRLDGDIVANGMAVAASGYVSGKRACAEEHLNRSTAPAPYQSATAPSFSTIRNQMKHPHKMN